MEKSSDRTSYGTTERQVDLAQVCIKVEILSKAYLNQSSSLFHKKKEKDSFK